MNKKYKKLVFIREVLALFVLICILLTGIGYASIVESAPLPVTLQWNRNADDFQLNTIDCTTNPKCFGYIVYWGFDDTTPNVLTRTPEIAHAFDVEPLLIDSAGMDLCFRLKAFNAGGESGFSEAACGQFPELLGKPGMPSGLILIRNQPTP